jgi:O-antigen ligase
MMELYLFLMLFFIPCFWYGAANGSHDFMAILFSAFVWIYWLFTGVPYDPLLFGIVIWFILSIAWSTHYGNSISDLLMILALITVVFAVQGMDKFLIMLFSFIPSAGMAGLEIYQWYKKQPVDRRGALFGNTNHSGIYYVINFFIGLWMAYNISLLFMPFCIIILLATVATRCRAAIMALCVGMGVVLFKDAGNIATIIICTLIGIVAIFTQRPTTLVTQSDYGLFLAKRAAYERWIIFKKTIKLIYKKPIWGWGLGTFRREHQLNLPAMATHRVHNDTLEILFEVGFVGLGLILYFFYALPWSDPFLSAALVAGIVSSCFFFTFRESHTAAPLMALCGLSLPPIGMVAIPPLISGVLFMALLYILWVHVIKKIVALAWYGMGSFKKTRDEQANCVAEAVKWFPNSEYMSRHSYYQSQSDPGASYESAMKMIYQYDGRVVLWGAFDQIARASYRVGAVNLADFFNRKALHINPDFEPSLNFRVGIDKLYQELKEKQDGKVAMY